MTDDNIAETVRDLTLAADRNLAKYELLEEREDGTKLYQRAGVVIAVPGSLGKTHPVRVPQNLTVHSAASFIDAVDHFRRPTEDDGTVYLDEPRRTCTVVLNDSSPERFGWADRRIIFTAQHTDAWKYWMSANGNLMSCKDFAEFINEGREDVREPQAAEMKALAENVVASTSARVQTSERLRDGQRTFILDETVQMSNGQDGKLEVPEVFELGLQPIEGSRHYRVEAELRFQIDDGRLRMGYKIVRPDDYVKQAFVDVTDDIVGRLSGGEEGGGPIGRKIEGPAPGSHSEPQIFTPASHT